jgi:hypothetical protein
MNIEKTLNQIAEDTGIHFHSFEQDNDVIIAKSHFFDFRFGPTNLEIINSHILPGPRLKNYLEGVLPFTIDYIVDNYYDILVEVMTEIYENCVTLEIRDNDDEEE